MCVGYYAVFGRFVYMVENVCDSCEKSCQDFRLHNISMESLYFDLFPMYFITRSMLGFPDKFANIYQFCWNDRLQRQEDQLF